MSAITPRFAAPFGALGWWSLQEMGPYQGPAPVPVNSIAGWMGWVLLIALVVLVLLMLSRNQDRFRRPPGVS
jgi:hypothetical protein